MAVGIVSNFRDSPHQSAHYALSIMGIFFYLAMHYSQMTPAGVTGYEVPLNLSAWIPVSWIIGLGLFQVAVSGKLEYSKLTLALGISVFLLVIPCLYPNSRKLLESPKYYGLLAGFLLFLASHQIFRERYQVTILAWLIFSSCFLEMMLGWVQYLGYYWFDFSILGFSLSKRPQGIFFQPNVTGSYLATGLMLTVYLLQFGMGQLRIDRFAKIILTTAPVFFIPVIIFLNSRTAWVGAGLGILLVQPCLWKLKEKKTTIAWNLSVITGLVLGYWSIAMTDTVSGTINKLNLETTRTFIYPQVLLMIKDNALMGYGSGTFESAYNLFSANNFSTGVLTQPGVDNLTHPHNELLYWWVEGGILGVLGLLLAAFFVVKKIFLENEWVTSLLFLSLLFPITLHTQTEMPFYSSIPHWIVFILLLFIVDTRNMHSSAINVRFGSSLKIFAVIVPFFSTVFLVTALHGSYLLTRYEYNRNVDISTLGSIVNPVLWQDRINWNINFGLLALGIFEKRPELIRPYIEWAPEIISRKPRGIYYQYLVIAYRAVGDFENAERVRKEAEFRLPNFPFNYQARGLDERNFPEHLKTTVLED